MKRRQTKQRQTILNNLQNRYDHPTADQLYSDLRQELPNISLGTVYRNLDVLSRDGLVRVINIAGMPRRFDGNTDNHDHIRCISCGRVHDLAPGRLPECEEIEIPGFTITRYSVELEGICADCRNTSS